MTKRQDIKQKPRSEIEG
ncbi:unnamed protein product [Acanthoscelides obtectus]|uniref:Uncharacterized protein n=1 Tax=Acanthoscelides obtectus TaxID=200917 RepID=A0A9P0LRA1_ACAOB|nr:unnamed protein product [Acanthoscelides obtectus]CAK1685977.1 hypothetical protein AOBTE_LOCUS35738 [Acanthoscelides obtectus]